jgi:transketolase
MGAYRLVEAKQMRQVVIAATGSEVAIAVQTAALLEAGAIGCDVVSVPCWERWLEQDPGLRASLFPREALRVSIEAGVTLGWERIIGADGLMIGIDSFGASAPERDLYRHFGLTPEAIAARVRALLG